MRMLSVKPAFRVPYPTYLGCWTAKLHPKARENEAARQVNCRAADNALRKQFLQRFDMLDDIAEVLQPFGFAEIDVERVF